MLAALKTYICTMKYLFLSVLTIGFFISCQSTNQQSENVKTSNSIQGLWQLHIMEVKDSADQWQEWRDGMQGYLLYDDTKHMALHLIPDDYEKTDLDFPNFTDTIPLEALKYITNNYNYFGVYSIDSANNIMTHTRISHSNPKEWHTEVQRRFWFSGDTLLMQPVEEKNARLRLKWLKKS